MNKLVFGITNVRIIQVILYVKSYVLNLEKNDKYNQQNQFWEFLLKKYYEQ